MEYIEYISEWLTKHPTTFHIIKYLLLVILILIIIAYIKRILRRKLPDSNFKYKSEKRVEIFGYVLIVIISISYFTGSTKDFGLAIGLLTAGIALTLQELVLSIAGSFYIFFVHVYKPGDRIEINGIKGDVIEIDSVYTTLMEIGEWISSDNYSGRIVKLSNAFVFKGPVYNYSQDFPFVWDEFNIPIRYGSDMELAKSIIITIASETLSEYVKESIADWKKIVDKYYIEDAGVNPTLAITMTDNWMQFNIRYIVDYKKRRNTKHILHEKISQEIIKTEGKVILASATFEIVKIPTIDVLHENALKDQKTSE